MIISQLLKLWGVIQLGLGGKRHNALNSSSMHCADSGLIEKYTNLF